jgi:hypothetical protein
VSIAVLGSVKLFPNLEDALKGVFNRVLKNLRKASASGTEYTGKWRGKHARHFAFHRELPDIRSRIRSSVL